MSNVSPRIRMRSALQSAETHRAVAAAAGSAGRSARHAARNRRSGPSVRKAAAGERPHQFEAILARSARVVHRWYSPQEVGNIVPSLSNSVNTKLAHSQAVQSRSRKHQSLAIRIGVARGRGRSTQLRVCALGYKGEIQLAVLARSVPSTRWPNPSIERTHNGGAQLRAPSRAVAPLCAAHVKR